MTRLGSGEWSHGPILVQKRERLAGPWQYAPRQIEAFSLPPSKAPPHVSPHQYPFSSGRACICGGLYVWALPTREGSRLVVVGGGGGAWGTLDCAKETWEADGPTVEATPEALERPPGDGGRNDGEPKGVF